MSISYTASAANGFKKWSAAQHPVAKYAPPNQRSGAHYSDGSGHRFSVARNARSFRPMTDFKHSTIHIQRAMPLPETAEAAPVGLP